MTYRAKYLMQALLNPLAAALNAPLGAQIDAALDAALGPPPADPPPDPPIPPPIVQDAILLPAQINGWTVLRNIINGHTNPFAGINFDPQAIIEQGSWMDREWGLAGWPAINVQRHYLIPGTLAQNQAGLAFVDWTHAQNNALACLAHTHPFPGMRLIDNQQGIPEWSFQYNLAPPGTLKTIGKTEYIADLLGNEATRQALVAAWLTWKQGQLDAFFHEQLELIAAALADGTPNSEVPDELLGHTRLAVAIDELVAGHQMRVQPSAEDIEFVQTHNPGEQIFTSPHHVYTPYAVTNNQPISITNPGNPVLENGTHATLTYRLELMNNVVDENTVVVQP
ncbi:hypothetical protein AB833_04475 [Chromatiales bacterium (ex Bugula neritina AB1)]|nr:hypothetical protein AB833_04475 [Chromatiales bacterium (ex Bugula neritina AB1)]